MIERDHEAMGRNNPSEQSRLTGEYDGRGGAHNAEERRVYRGIFRWRAHCDWICRGSAVGSIADVFTGCRSSRGTSNLRAILTLTHFAKLVATVKYGLPGHSGHGSCDE